MQQLYIVPVGKLNVELMKHSTYGGSGQVRLFVGNLGSGQRFAGSSPRKVTRGQLWSGYTALVGLSPIASPQGSHQPESGPDSFTVTHTHKVLLLSAPLHSNGADYYVIYDLLNII